MAEFPERRYAGDMRRVLHIPILHSAADLGSLAESVRAEYARALGPAGWSRHQEAVEQLWRAIRARIEALDLNYAKTRIYQDGLPVCGFERKIVEELAKAGSSNHQLVAELVEKGAVLEGTEDPQLLVQEYQLQQRISHRARTSPGARSPDGASPFDAEARALLEARNRFVAERIARTLQEGETALVFLGAAHRLDTLQEAGIRVETV
jgi:hypothetical protein